MNSTTNGTHRHEPIAGGGPTTACCPACGSPITRQEYENILRIDEAKQKQYAKKDAALQEERETLARERVSIGQAAVAEAHVKWREEAGEARNAAAREQKRLSQAHEKALAVEARKRAAAEKELARERTRAEAKAKATADARVRDAEEKKDRVIGDLRDQLKTSEQRRRRDDEAFKKTVADLHAKADARDRAHFGPEGEEDLVRLLCEHFPGDRIEHRGKKGDVLHAVLDAGQPVGTIIYEVKNTKGWERAYLRQMKLAMESHGTKHGILVSKTLPPRRAGMFVLDGVIVVEPSLAVQIVPIVRDSIVALSRLKLSDEGRATKTAELFEYLRGDEFSNAIGIVNDKISELRDALSRERSFHDGWWRTREQHYAAILRETTGIEARVKDILGRRPDSALRAKGLSVKRSR